MIREEMKKLYIKQFGLILTIILFIGEIVFVSFLYPKRQFTSENTERHFYEYMEKFSGKLTSKKESEILAEQERIVDARNRAKAIENRLYSGEYESEDEFIAEYEKNHMIIERKESFDLIFDQYSYALEAPDERYLTVGDYNGMTADLPDVLILTLVIFLTGILFLNEESSGVITFVRISTNGKQRTLCGKLAAISVFILSAQIFRTALELFIMISRGDIRELSYPIQTLEFFQNSPYNVTILQGFLIISALRLLGYLFVAALIILLSVTLRKALFTIFIPSAVCLLQQFAFDPVTPAYYIPTGFLRGVGYLRGSLSEKDIYGEDISIFSEIPLSFLIPLVIITSVFIVFSIMTAYCYYTGKKIRFPKKTLAAASVFSLCISLSGCAGSSEEPIKFNLWESRRFAQNDEFFYVSDWDELKQISKKDDTELSMLHNSLSSERIYFDSPIFLRGNYIYNVGSTNIYRLSLSNCSLEQVYALNYFGSPGFMDINLVNKLEISLIDSEFQSFFVVDEDYFYVYTNRILKNGKCIVDEEFYRSMVCFDGRKIYYINSLLQLKCYDIVTGEITRLPGEFVKSIYYDGTRLLFSDKNGIFSLSIDDNSIKKISNQTAEQITSNGDLIVYLSDGKLYLFDEPSIEIYNGDFEAFAIISGTNKLAVVQYTGEYELLELPN